MKAFDWLMLALGVLGIVAPHWLFKTPPLWRDALTVLGVMLLVYSGLIYAQEATGMKLHTWPLIGVLTGVAIVGASVTWNMQMTDAKSQPAPAEDTSGMGDNNTFYGNVHPAARMGSGNTIIGPTDERGNTIIRPPAGGLAVGSGAKAGPGGISIGAGAGSGQKPDK